ncbi:MAG: UDP-N-acetylmuramoyl-L-alanine--D-glutamate ligase [Neisseriales bacterium]|nr:MAG: UDP-N-acetylmuramoyl-L-alanine--D-glutamate ligase [Neisseriales bacterium]
MLAGKKFIVLGLGDTGLASAFYLVQHGAEVVAFDHQKIPAKGELFAQLLPNVPLYTERLADRYWQQADYVLVSPGVPLANPDIMAFRQKGGSILGDIELFARLFSHHVSGKVIAITGSNGKSTVTEWVGHLCRICQCDTVVAGNIGLPILKALWDKELQGRMPAYWVLELSSFQLDVTQSLNADAAVVLNIAEDHLDRYPDLLHYAASKAHIFNGQGVQVINADDPLCLAMQRKGRVIRQFSLRQNADYHVSAGDVLIADGISLLSTQALLMLGKHNAANALAALALCEALRLPRAPLLTGLKTFRGLPHRIERVDQINGITYIDDSKGTNVAATEAALLSMPKKVVLIAGGAGKMQDFSLLNNALQKVGRAVVLIGEDAQKIHEAIAGLRLPIQHCQTLEEATWVATNLAKAGDTVLLSPACASFDMFNNYAHRAQVFRDAVSSLKPICTTC